MNRMLGRSEISVSPLGLGCWAIGGEFTLDGLPDGWGRSMSLNRLQGFMQR